MKLSDSDLLKTAEPLYISLSSEASRPYECTGPTPPPKPAWHNCPPLFYSRPS
ncbi:hypothetical protein T492DRAFT_1086437 [Pavlovales sp. CCMP2436]|nr:hypothetical protein T492DRAFT_1086437 [Pavlovales sp. CCMP2436]